MTYCENHAEVEQSCRISDPDRAHAPPVTRRGVDGCDVGIRSAGRGVQGPIAKWLPVRATAQIALSLELGIFTQDFTTLVSQPVEIEGTGA